MAEDTTRLNPVILKQVANRRLQEFWIISELPQTAITVKAKQPTHLSCLMIMVNIQSVIESVFTFGWIPTDCTSSILSVVHFLKDFRCHTIENPTLVLSTALSIYFYAFFCLPSLLIAPLLTIFIYRLTTFFSVLRVIIKPLTILSRNAKLAVASNAEPLIPLVVFGQRSDNLARRAFLTDGGFVYNLHLFILH